MHLRDLVSLIPEISLPPGTTLRDSREAESPRRHELIVKLRCFEFLDKVRDAGCPDLCWSIVIRSPRNPHESTESVDYWSDKHRVEDATEIRVRCLDGYVFTFVKDDDL